MYCPTMPAWRLVPEATILMRRAARISSTVIGTSLRRTVDSSSRMRGSIVSRSACGCSKISLIMWCGNSLGWGIISSILRALKSLYAAAQDCLLHRALRIEKHQIGIRARFQFALRCSYADDGGRIQRGKTDRLLQRPVGKRHHVSDCAIHGEN